MRPIYLTVVGTGTSSVAPMNVNTSPFNVGFGVKVTGTINYTIQHTFDNVWASDFNPATATWFDHPTVASLAANADGNYAFPVAGIRLKTNSGGGTAALTIIQAGIQ
jgi:hypothetical protein